MSCIQNSMKPGNPENGEGQSRRIERNTQAMSFVMGSHDG